MAPEIQTQTTQVAAPIIAAFIAALLGSFFGALFKEQLADIFFKRKRKREIRSEIIKLTVQFFRKLTTHIDAKNAYKILNSRRYALRERNRMKGTLTEAERNTTDTSFKNMFEYLKEMHTKDSIIFNEMMIIESQLISLAAEASHYFTKRKTASLKTDLKQLLEQAIDENIMVYGYDKLPYAALVTFQENEYPKQLEALRIKAQDKMHYYVERISKVLS
jgi:hypothetical protein